MKSHLECYTHVVTSRSCQSVQTRELARVRNARAVTHHSRALNLDIKLSFIMPKSDITADSTVYICIFLFLFFLPDRKGTVEADDKSDDRRS